MNGPSKEHVLKLKELEAKPHIKHRHTRHGDVCICVIRHERTGQELGRAEVPVGNDEAETKALEAAIDQARPYDARRGGR